MRTRPGDVGPRRRRGRATMRRARVPWGGATRCGLWTAGILVLALSGCAAPGATDRPEAASSVGRRVTRLGPLLHVVFVRLKDPLDTAAFVDSCNTLAASVPSVRAAHAGLHEEIGRDTIVRDYDVLFVTAFDDVEGYRAYLEHPEHLRLLEQWRPRIEWLRISDAMDVPE